MHITILDISSDTLAYAIEDTFPAAANASYARWEPLEVNGGLEIFNLAIINAGRICIVVTEDLHLKRRTPPRSNSHSLRPHDLGRLPPSLLVTTPSYGFNAHFSPPGLTNTATGFPDPTKRTDRVFRHHDHKFEWTVEEFQEWCRHRAGMGIRRLLAVRSRKIGGAEMKNSGRKSWFIEEIGAMCGGWFEVLIQAIEASAKFDLQRSKGQRRGDWRALLGGGGLARKKRIFEWAQEEPADDLFEEVLQSEGYRSDDDPGLDWGSDPYSSDYGVDFLKSWDLKKRRQCMGEGVCLDERVL
ncbi:uncharacterized protein EDB93DRAFT_1340943 [Suillus bovinus]|uniref:uncharacterized protein n=1 Tax=Suillus bovinus TaxID=48563 RepID=UPI001B88656E|nr:uncharacterized protein EDB93DRAFT_1340943 [Suillus bovinus]KAG2127628.1 hypothetical protein EDB93DRAFT_1340943 [Suillus bovinus]